MSVERQQGRAYQGDLFDEALLKALRPDASGDGGTEPAAGEESQALAALAQQRALTQDLMERVASSANLNQAYKRVKANKGAPGVDGMTVSDLRSWIADNKDVLVAQLMRGDYRPQPVKRVEIPKPSGGMRQLGIPTVVDRLVQQAILQVLQPILEPNFSTSSFGFRPGRSAHDALAQAGKYVSQGYGIVVDLDLEKFFDRVNHDILMARLARRIGDKRLLRIIRRFLEAGMMAEGVCVRRQEGQERRGPGRGAQVPRLSAPDGWHLGGRPAKRGPPEAEGSADHPAQPGRPPARGDRGAQRLPVRMGHLLPSRLLPDPAAPPRGLDPAQVALFPPQAVQASPSAGGLPAKSWGTGMASLASRPQRQGLLAQRIVY